MKDFLLLLARNFAVGLEAARSGEGVVPATEEDLDHRDEMERSYTALKVVVARFDDEIVQVSEGELAKATDRWLAIVPAEDGDVRIGVFDEKPELDS